MHQLFADQQQKLVRHNSSRLAPVASVPSQTRILQAITGPCLTIFLRPIIHLWQHLRCLLSAACEYSIHLAENQQSYSEDCTWLTFWSEVEVERCFKVLPKGLSHIDGGLLCESSGLFKKKKATEIRYRTPGEHPDIGFDPKKGLWSFPCWLLIHRQLTTCWCTSAITLCS